MIQKEIRCTLLTVLCLSWLTGCGDPDRHREVAEVAREGANRQAQQNSEMVRLNREVVEGTRRMVEANAEARKEMVVVHQEIQAERDSLNVGFSLLESERKQIAEQRRTESVVVPALKTIGGALVALSAAVLCLVLLIGQRKTDSSDAELNELLICDMVREQPQLLLGTRSQPAIENNPPNNDSPSTLLITPEQDSEESSLQGDPA